MKTENIVGLRLQAPVSCSTNYSRREELLAQRTFDVIQPDICGAGGLTELRRIAVLADAFGAASTLHVSIGSAIHFVAPFHAAAAMPNLVRHEYWMGENPLGDAPLFTPSLALDDGSVRVRALALPAKTVAA